MSTERDRGKEEVRPFLRIGHGERHLPRRCSDAGTVERVTLDAGEDGEQVLPVLEFAEHFQSEAVAVVEGLRQVVGLGVVGDEALA